MSFYNKLEFTESGRLKRGEMKKLTEEEKHQYYLDYNKKYYAKAKPYEVRKNKKIQNEGKLMTNADFLKERNKMEKKTELAFYSLVEDLQKRFESKKDYIESEAQERIINETKLNAIQAQLCDKIEYIAFIDTLMRSHKQFTDYVEKIWENERKTLIKRLKNKIKIET